MKPSMLNTASGRQIAYHQITGSQPGVVFLGGFKSDMEGTKAIHLQEWAEASNRPFLRFDYSGHGQSSGDFADGCIGDWAQDAMDAIGTLTEGPQVLVGSSMGGWISLLVCRAMPTRVHGLVGVAAAPDFTEDSMWASFDETQRRTINENGQLDLPSDYDDSPYIITKKLIEEGRNQLVLRKPLPLPFPVRFLQGTDDADVDQSVALRLLDHVSGDDVRLTLVKGADHRFSTPECLAMMTDAIDQITAAVEPTPR